MIPYILHVSILIAVSVLFYKVALKKLTFYMLNRWILLICLVAAFVSPLLPMPRGWSWVRGEEGKAAAVQVNKISPVGETVPLETMPVYKPEPVTTAPEMTVQAHRTSPVETVPVVSKHERVKPGPAAVPKPALASKPAPVAVNWHMLLFYLYLSGVIIMGINLLRQTISLLRQSFKGTVIRDGRFRIVTMSGMHAPCSFGNIIFIQPDAYDPETFSQILLHEKIHAGGWHTVDILLAELGIMFQWFNPFIWLFRREMENNLEFLTDRNVLKNPGIERSAYQLSLIKVAVPDMSLSITSNYNQSLLKRRIIMMNTQTSALHAAWKYLFLLPLFILLACLLNHPAVQAQSKTDRVAAAPAKAKKSTAPAPATPAKTMAIPVAVDEAQPEVVSAPVTVAISETMPDVTVAPVPVPPVATPVPVPAPAVGDTSKPFDHVDRSEGAWFILSNEKSKDDKVHIELRNNGDGREWNSNFSVQKSELVNFSSVGKVDFTLTREAGTIHFTGQFDGEQGFGHYKFQADAGYLKHMQEKKLVDAEAELVTFFMLDIKKGYVDMLQANGFPDISRGHLISMSALGIDEVFIKSMHESGYTDISEGHLITFKALHIDKAFIDDIRKAGYDHPEISRLITFKSLKIDGDYIRRFPAATPAGDIITYKSLHIDSAYVASLKKAGYPDLSSRDIVSLRSMNVDAGYIKGLNEMGFSDMPVHFLISFKSQNINGEYVKGFRDVGYKDITPENLISMKAMQVTPEFVKGFLALGYKDINPQQLISLKAMNITPDFIKGFNSIGFKDIPLNQLHSLKAMGVTPDYVSKMKEKGFVSDDLNKYIRLKNAFN